MSIANHSTERFVLRNLPLAARVVISVFLISVGIGYLSALVQLKVQHASAGQIMPGLEEVKDTFYGKAGIGQIERLILADESKPFNGSGSMRSAFTFRSASWKREVREREEKELRKERQLEIDSLVTWIRAGAKEDDYKQFLLPDNIVKRLPPEPDSDFFKQDEKKQWMALVGNIIEIRCARCHAEGKSAGRIHIDEYKTVMDYIPPEKSGGMSLAQLAQTTHVHLLGFSMLYGLMGLIFAFTSYPAPVRLFLAPLPLIAQVADISFWWLTARVDPVFAFGVLAMGGVVGPCLSLQIVLSFWDMYEKKGKAVVIALLLAGAAIAGLLYFEVINPYLEQEKTAATSQEKSD